MSPFDKLIDWLWAICLGLVGLVWKLMHGRIEAIEKAHAETRDLILSRIEKSDETMSSKIHTLRGEMHAQGLRQDATITDIVGTLGEIKGEIKAGKK